ncbi:hypothetical protein J7E97_27570 [Streptomyces sp. ISL-66]|uniref:hypothetical protein n=1 Tax=Streptomyces sp. ISL-66 TaxID=2819186 RepID=UPI001BEA08BE|nr:hypothetical protein [Streptomyces sp. ISL-66]MBT2471521.1 hypothetical protein [Streptomyces sp. ISL-66]
MSKDKHPRTTTPSQAPGESGDPEARKEAEEAVIPTGQDGEAGDALTPNTGAQRRTAKDGKAAREQKRGRG